MFSQFSLVITLLLVFTAAIAGGVLAQKFKQPSLLGYIAAGILLGNVFTRFIDSNFLDLMAHAGITLLLFTLGIEFSFHRLRKILTAISWAVIVQILVSIIIFLMVFLWVGMPFVGGLFFALAASLSSTAVVTKLLADRGELETQPGEILTGWLVIQDLAVIPMMLILPIFVSANVGVDPVSVIGLVLLNLVKSGLVLIVVVLLGKFGVPKFFNFIASFGNSEIFLLTVVGLVVLAAVGSYALGLSMALGAFIAGLIIAETSQNHAIFAEIRPLRDIFAVVFFVSLGLALPLSIVGTIWPQLLIFASVVLIAKFGIVTSLMRFLGYHRKVAFFVGIGLTQMSEFGFILAREGKNLGVLSENHYTLLIALTFLTIFVSMPFFGKANRIYYSFLSKIWPKILRENDEQNFHEELAYHDHVVICGFGRVGKYIGKALELSAIPFVIVDYNHAVASKLRKNGYKVIYGDPAEKNILDYAQVDLAKTLVVAIPDRHTQEMIIANAQTLNKRIKIICRSHHEEDHSRLKSLGVNTIVQPEFEAALSISASLLNDFGISQADISNRLNHLQIEQSI